MDLILLLVWMTPLLFISSYNCQHPYYGYGGVSRFNYENYGPPLQRSDHESYALDKNEPIRQRQRYNYDFENYGPKGSIAVPLPVPSTNSRSGQMEERPSSEDSVVLPGLTNFRDKLSLGPARRQYIPEVPESCKEMQICDKVANYPTELAASIIAGLGEIRSKFTFDQIQPEIEPYYGTENMEFCSLKREVMIPLAARLEDGEWYFVLNNIFNPLQGCRVEICNNTGGACDSGIATFHKKYHATCRQKYIQRSMAVIDEAGEVKYDMLVHVPSCCSCVATDNGK